MATHESFSRGSEEVYHLICLPCHADGTTLPAHGYCTECKEHLCYSCYQHHTKPRPCRHHTLMDKVTMPSTQELSDIHVHAGTTENLTTPCPRHKIEMIRFYCHDHELLLCSICTTLEHTKPCHVDYIPEISDKMINSQDYEHTITRIDELLKKCTKVETETSRNANKANDSLQEASQKVQKYRQEINKRCDELQQRIEGLRHQNDEKKKSTGKICEDVMKMVKVTCDSIKQLNTSKQGDQLFTEVKQAQKQLHDYERSITCMSTEGSINEYKFIPSQAINDILHKEEGIGDISTTHQAQHAASQSNIQTTSADENISLNDSSQSNIPTTSADQNISLKGQHEISVNVVKDRNICFITGMTFLPPNRLILSDANNHSLKLVDVSKQSITYRLTVGHFISDITSTTSTQVALTVQEYQLIQFISVSDKLRKSHTVNTNGKCNGICCYQNKLIVTYVRAGKIEILDMDGRLITKVKTDETLNTPTYVQANSSTIYVAIAGLKEVIMLNWQGEITGRIRDMNNPGGLALLHDGSLIVCDITGHVLQVVTGDGIRCIKVLQKVTCPWTVCLDEGGHKLYISRRTDLDHIANNILVYNI